ncbi:MAG: hypothetical protein OXQ93_13975 [Gemmatimonadota bacterium]|nr:hypothetical protein [Gemmatimonadota bacterium]
MPRPAVEARRRFLAEKIGENPTISSATLHRLWRDQYPDLSVRSFRLDLQHARELYSEALRPIRLAQDLLEDTLHRYEQAMEYAMRLGNMTAYAKMLSDRARIFGVEARSDTVTMGALERIWQTSTAPQEQTRLFDDQEILDG